jgi:16S rRNA (guanine(1405)-N(7))-methyltransferase
MEKGVSIEKLIADVLEKKELSGLDPGFVRSKVDALLKKRPDLSRKLASVSSRSGDYKNIVKEIRSQLREVYGVFVEGRQDRDALLDRLEGPGDLDTVNRILSLHRSSKERLSIYPEAYKEIFSIIGEPARIVDLACGLNPVSYPYLGFKPDYLACDISTTDLAFIMRFFQRLRIEGSVRQVDLLTDDISGLAGPDDVVFLLKALDSLETVKRNSSESVLKSLACKRMVVSFATLSIGGRKPIRSSRKWFELMAQRLGFNIERIDFPNEMFYILRR